MKKFTIFGLVALILSAVIFTSCNESLIGVENKWCPLTTTVKDQKIKLYFYYTKDEAKITYDDGDKDMTLPAGLTVIASTTVDAGVNATPYVLKTFELGKEEEFEDEEAEDGKKSFTFKGTMWDAIYLKFYKSDFQGKEKDEAPAILDNGTPVSQLADLFSEYKDLSWKDILIEVLNVL